MTIQFVECDGGRAEAGFKSTRAGDCVARAIAIASGLPYREVYDALAHGNSTQRNSKNSGTRGPRSASNGVFTQREWFKRYMRSIGFVWVPTMHIGSGCKLHLSADELPKGRLVLCLSKHYAAVIDRVLFDTFDCSQDGRRCVYGYWRFIAPGEQLPLNV